jgi:hypothetical protein
VPERAAPELLRLVVGGEPEPVEGGAKLRRVRADGVEVENVGVGRDQTLTMKPRRRPGRPRIPPRHRVEQIHALS